MTLTANTLMKPLSKFLACMTGTAAICLGAYTLTVDHLVQGAELPGTYKWFLLQNVPGPRLIFESGSNSHHAIDTDMISKALGITAINIADNGGYALEDKVTRLETYTRAGDIVVLPLEWTFYHREQLTDNYVETLFTDNRDYYRSQPILKRAKRALSLPPGKVFTQISKTKNHSPFLTESPAQDLYISALTQPTGHQSRAASIGPGLGVAEQSCDDYILGKAAQRKELKLGANIKPVLTRLKKLKRRGVKIHFAWPAIAGDGCMTDPAYVSGFRAEIEQAINQAGFEFLAAPSQSLYGQDVRDDSPYHLTTAGTEIHTKKMIGYLEAHGYGQSGPPLNIRTFAAHRLLEMELANIAPIQQSVLPLNQIIKMDDPEHRRYAEFSAGWWGFEPYGRWMRDNRAMFRLTLPADTPANAVLKIQGSTKSRQAERVNMSINGEMISSGLFGDGTPLLLPTEGLPRGETLSIFLTLPEAGPPQSPLERGENQDARSMTLHLQSLLLSVSEPQAPPKLIELAKPDNTPTFKSAASPFSDIKTVFTATSLDNCAPIDDFAVATSQPVAFTQGWWPQESAGRWMKSQKATFKLTLPQTKFDQFSGRYQLKLNGDFFLGRPQFMTANINGQQNLPFQIRDDGSFVALFESSRESRKIDVTLLISGQIPQSPKALGLSNDDRTLTYFLKSAELIPV